MKNALTAAALLLSLSPALAQTGGSAAAYNRNRDPAALEAAKRQPTPAELRAEGDLNFVSASILMNVPADEYVAVFAVTEEGATPEAASAKIDATLGTFKSALKGLGVKEADTFTDFIGQTRVYGYRLEAKSATEELAGFEIKKNVSIHFRDKALLEKLVAAAAKARIYDLIKVDYIVKDLTAIQAKLQSQTTALLESKVKRYQKELGFSFPPSSRILADKPGVYYPVQQYDSYEASEAENVSLASDEANFVVKRARKTRSTFFNPLSNEDFDLVINPIVTEPVVQLTTYLKVQYGVLPTAK